MALHVSTSCQGMRENRNTFEDSSRGTEEFRGGYVSDRRRGSTRVSDRKVSMGKPSLGSA